MTLLRPTLQGRAGFDPNGYGPGVNAPFGRSATYFRGTRNHNGQDYFWLGAASAKRLGISTAASKNVYPVMAGKVFPIDSASLGTGAWQQINSTHRFYYWHMSKRIYNTDRNMRTVDRIGIMGSTGTAAGSDDHVHIEVRKAPYRAQDRIDPEPFFVALTDAQKARYRKIATFLNPHAKNVGRVGTTTASDGIPGENYWYLVQAVSRAWGFYDGAVDGKPGPKTYAAENRLWAEHVNKPAPTPAPPAVEPAPVPTPEPVATPEPVEPEPDPVAPETITPRPPRDPKPQPSPHIPREEDPMNDKPLVDPDLDKLDDALETIAEQVSPFLSPEVRARVYAWTTVIGATAAAAGASLLSAAAFIGGEVAVTLVTVGGIATVIGSGLGAASAVLAKRNTPAA